VIAPTSINRRADLYLPARRQRKVVNFIQTTFRIGCFCFPARFGTSNYSRDESGSATLPFGAARDRIPVSAIDPLESPLGQRLLPKKERMNERGRIRVQPPLNVVAIRSGQYWANAQTEQKTDYLERRQPKLSRGMKYLEENKEASGCLSVRVMSNLNAAGDELPETSTLAYFLSLSHMEDCPNRTRRYLPTRDRHESEIRCQA